MLDGITLCEFLAVVDFRHDFRRAEAPEARAADNLVTKTVWQPRRWPAP